jgi:hypothetical protein
VRGINCLHATFAPVSPTPIWLPSSTPGIVSPRPCAPASWRWSRPPLGVADDTVLPTMPDLTRGVAVKTRSVRTASTIAESPRWFFGTPLRSDERLPHTAGKHPASAFRIPRHRVCKWWRT